MITGASRSVPSVLRLDLACIVLLAAHQAFNDQAANMLDAECTLQSVDALLHVIGKLLRTSQGDFDGAEEKCSSSTMALLADQRESKQA